MKMKQILMCILLFMLAAVCMPVQAEGKNTAKAETVTADVNRSGAGKSVVLKNTKGKNAKDVKALKKIITRQNSKNNKISTNLNSKQYKWEKGRLVRIDWTVVRLKGSISFAGLTQLKELYCVGNQLSNLDVSKNKKLEELSCAANKLSKLNVSKNTELKELYCFHNKLSKLNVSKNTKLEYLYCANNQLSNLNVSKNTKLKELYCANNQLSNLDVSKNTKLKELWCSDNQLSNLDVSKNTKLKNLTCDNNVEVNGCDSNIIYYWTK